MILILPTLRGYKRCKKRNRNGKGRLFLDRRAPVDNELHNGGSPLSDLQTLVNVGFNPMSFGPNTKVGFDPLTPKLDKLAPSKSDFLENHIYS